MDLNEALSLIKAGLKEEVVESKHFIDQCIDRKINVHEVKKVISNHEMVGILKHEVDLYKIWFLYKQHKDLNIIVKIMSDKRLRLVTIFPCYSERRKR